MLQSNWSACGWLTWTKVLASDATLPWWLSPDKRSKISIDSSQKYSLSKNPTIWLYERHTWLHPTKSGGLEYYFPLMTLFMQKKKKTYQLTLSEEIDDKRILKSDYTRVTQPRKIVTFPSFPWRPNSRCGVQ